MRGIDLLHEAHPISTIWDSGEPGTTTDSPEYEVYMDIRRRVATKEVQARNYWELGEVVLRCLNSRWPDYSDPNEQSIVMKVEYRGSSVMLGGDTNYRPWKEKILPFYDANKLLSSIFYAPHHGALTFFDDPSDTKYYFVDHIKKINPAMTLISVGPNIHGLPDKKAIELYEKHSTGSSKGNKVYTTEAKGNMKLILKEDGGWSLNVNQ